MKLSGIILFGSMDGNISSIRELYLFSKSEYLFSPPFSIARVCGVEKGVQGSGLECKGLLERMVSYRWFNGKWSNGSMFRSKIFISFLYFF